MKTMIGSVRPWALVCVCMLAGPWLAAQAGGAPPAAPNPSAPQEPAAKPAATEPAGAKLVVGDACKVALGEAKTVAARVKGLDGPERQTALEAAAAAYAKVMVDHPADEAGCATAAYQAAELWRRHGSLEKAVELYLEAARRDPGRWAERGFTGAADMLRRQKNMDQALVHYRQVVALGLTSNRSHDARVWVARCLETTGAAEEALQAFRDAFESADTPRQVIDGGDWLAKALVARGDLEGARVVLDQVTASVAAVDIARPEERARLDKAIEGMTARRQLQRALDKARNAAGDAQQVDGK